MAVVQVVGSGKTKDQYLAACLRNLWLLTAAHDIELSVEHIQGEKNVTADLLSRLYSNRVANVHLLSHLKDNFIWDKVSIDDLKVDFNI